MSWISSLSAEIIPGALSHMTIGQAREAQRERRAMKTAFARRFTVKKKRIEKNPPDDEGVIVAGPDARARARGEKTPTSDDESTEKPVRDTHDAPAPNPKTSVLVEKVPKSGR